jgi:hypothetical protein
VLNVSLPTVRIEIVPAEDIKPHEVADPGRERRIEQRIRDDDVLRDPLIAGEVPDLDGYVLLDGTNRRQALEAVGLPWSMVQIIDYTDRSAVDLGTWCHSAHIDMSSLLERAKSIPDIVVERVAPLEVAEALAVPRTIALALDREQGYAFRRQAECADSRADTLRSLVDLYEESLTRVDCDPEEVGARSLQTHGSNVLIAFPPFSRSQVVTMAARGLLVPAGITRHIILRGRALRVNVPLQVLRAPSLEEARARFRKHLDGLRPRVYGETTILYDS